MNLCTVVELGKYAVVKAIFIAECKRTIWRSCENVL
jgi:hypothetical protein